MLLWQGIFIVNKLLLCIIFSLQQISIDFQQISIDLQQISIDFQQVSIDLQQISIDFHQISIDLHQVFFKIPSIFRWETIDGSLKNNVRYSSDSDWPKSSMLHWRFIEILPTGFGWWSLHLLTFVCPDPVLILSGAWQLSDRRLLWPTVCLWLIWTALISEFWNTLRLWTMCVPQYRRDIRSGFHLLLSLMMLPLGVFFDAADRLHCWCLRLLPWFEIVLKFLLFCVCFYGFVVLFLVVWEWGPFLP